MPRRALIAAIMLCFALAGCADPLEGRAVSASSVLASPNPWPTPQIVHGGPPHILACWMNTTHIPNGTDWVGRIVTSTNVASVEIRTESFSFNAERTAYGDFNFKQHVIDWAPQYKRGYTLQVIARNAAGDQDTLLIPVDFR